VGTVLILFFPCVTEKVFLRIWKLNFGKEFALIICSAVFIVQLPKCLGVGCAA
jgi:hypothetical protein